MKFTVKCIFVFVFLLTVRWQGAGAQSIKLFGGDLLNGAVNGTALGAATMALQNSGDTGPLRVGAGLGVLYGLGTGIYDNSITPKGQRFYKSGTFNDARNSTIIPLLDTLYGAIGGAAVGGAIALIGNNPFLDGLQYGSGAGAWIGFGFGLIDSFVLAERPNQYEAAAGLPKAPGLVQITPAVKSISIGLIHPAIFSHKVISAGQIKTKYSPSVELMNMRFNF